MPFNFKLLKIKKWIDLANFIGIKLYSRFYKGFEKLNLDFHKECFKKAQVIKRWSH